MSESKEFIKKLKSNKNGYIFLQPIEELVNSLPDYKENIKHPIDLLKIEDKLNKFGYNTIEDMKEDIELMINNCLTYNYQPNSWANKSAVQFSFFFNNNYKKFLSLIGYDETTIRFSSIGSVSRSAGLIFCDVTIETNGGVTIIANGFTRSDANTIVSLLNR